MCEDSNCNIIDKMSNWFDVKSTIHEDYIMSGFLFIVAVD